MQLLQYQTQPVGALARPVAVNVPHAIRSRDCDAFQRAVSLGHNDAHALALGAQLPRPFLRRAQAATAGRDEAVGAHRRRICSKHASASWTTSSVLK